MKLSHIIEAREIYAEIEKDPKFARLIKEYEAKDNPLFSYKRLRPRFGYRLGFLHGHTDGYSLDEIAERVALVGGSFFAVADHDEDAKRKKESQRFADSEIIRIYDFHGKHVVLIKGMECNLKDEHSLNLVSNKGKKIIALGYEGRIQPRMSLDDTIKACKDRGALILATAPFNTGSRGLDQEDLEKYFADIDAIGVLESSFGFGGVGWTRLNYSDILAKYFALGNNSRKQKKAMFSEGNAHILAEIGVAGDYVPKEYLPSLDSPEKLQKNPQMIIEELRGAFKAGVLMNAGVYLPVFGLLHPARLKVVVEEAFESLKRKFGKTKALLDS